MQRAFGFGLQALGPQKSLEHGLKPGAYSPKPDEILSGA